MCTRASSSLGVLEANIGIGVGDSRSYPLSISIFNLGISRVTLAMGYAVAYMPPYVDIGG